MDYIRWYNDGKFGDPEKFEIPKPINDITFKTGDIVDADTLILWTGNKWKTITRENFLRELIIKDVKYVKHVGTPEYTGYTVRFVGSIPWFQTTGLKKN